MIRDELDDVTDTVVEIDPVNYNHLNEGKKSLRKRLFFNHFLFLGTS